MTAATCSSATVWVTEAGSIFFPDLIAPQRRIGSRNFDFSRRVAVVAILNRTPDSFHDKGRTFELDSAVDEMKSAVDEGADWVDIGGMPFGVEAPEVSEQEEIERIMPLLETVRSSTDAVISIDTFRTEVARRALGAGADAINDTSGLHDPNLADLIAESGATLVIAHSLASPPRTRVIAPTYGDVVTEVAAFLMGRVKLALSRGVRPEQIIIDPGHDLNKNTLHSLELTRRLAEITSLGYPTLVALSNKDFIGETLDRAQDDRLEGTVAAGVFCVLQGARILRVHDVRAGVAAVRMTEAILGWREPAWTKHNL